MLSCPAAGGNPAETCVSSRTVLSREPNSTTHPAPPIVHSRFPGPPDTRRVSSLSSIMTLACGSSVFPTRPKASVRVENAGEHTEASPVCPRQDGTFRTVKDS
ncbi:hypothetical protein [Leptospirillum sp. Group II 'CF-1']|uniref:hypothetical protein n=1 Tax=Leptospirillum sp. Group II 'CF-1' TaxID=1660083 RepID=UPI0012E2FA22|nr:hypothetical protein [Leptospirillum sp. Group II 'CF-1']